VKKIKHAGVIGAGIMGGGVAALLASAGIETLLLDIVPPNLEDDEKKDPVARNRFAINGLKAVQKSKPPLLTHPKAAGLIQVGNIEDDLKKLAHCDWMVEVVVEDLDVKQKLFKRIQKVWRPGTIVSSNTSGIPLAQISEGLKPEFCQHFLGTHFFNPVRYMTLLELIPGPDTAPEILTDMAAFGETVLGKGIVWGKDTPNFVANRIGVQGMVQAMRAMVEEGVTIPEVDTLFGPGLGRPKTAMFKTGDLVGIDTLVHVANNTYNLIPADEARESFKVPPFVLKMAEQKLLGNKTGAGFYKKEFDAKGKPVKLAINPETLAYEPFENPRFDCIDRAKAAKTLPEKIKAIVYGEDRGAKFAWMVLAANLIYSANRIPEIADTIVEIDNAMRWGFNFTLGPFETWDAIGVQTGVDKMVADGMEVPEAITTMLKNGCDSFYSTQEGKKLFYDFASQTYQPAPESEGVLTLAALKAKGQIAQSCDSADLVDLGDGVFCLEFKTKMNVLNEEVIDFVKSTLPFVEENGVGLVIGNQAGGVPGAFSAGADLKFMGRYAMQGQWDKVAAFVEKAQNNIMAARYSHVPIVAAPFGLTFGGGCEICLGAADRIVAHSELYMGLVEVGVGLLPAAGGCLYLWRKLTESIPEGVDVVDLAPWFLRAFKTIAMGKVSGSAADACRLGFLGPNDRIVANRMHLISEAKKEVLRLADGYRPITKQPVRVIGAAAQGMVNAELHNMQSGGYVSEYDSFIGRKVAHVISGGQVRSGAEIDEGVILAEERKAFIELWKQEKTWDRVEHMLKTGRRLRN